MQDRLATLARLRRLQADLARRDLANALREEASAETALLDARQATQREARHLEAGEDLLLAAAFAGWLPKAASTLCRRSEEASQASRLSLQARGRLADSKAALEAIEILQAERATQTRKALERRAQAALDDMAQRKQAPAS